MIQATRLKPVVVGRRLRLVRTLHETLQDESSLSPLSSAACNWSRILVEDWQPTWLHSSRTWPHPQVHIMRCRGL